MGKRNLTWTEEMDDLLVDSLMDQMRKGQKKVGGVFSKRALATVSDLISEQFDLFCHSDHIKNRMKTLRTNFNVAKGILSSRGFSLNHSSQVIEARASVWETYIKAHPKASKLRYKRIRNYEKMDLLVGKDLVPKSSTLLIGTRESQLPRATEEVDVDVEDVTPLESNELRVDNDDPEEEELETSSAPDPTSASKKGNTDRKRAKVNHHHQAEEVRCDSEAVVSEKSSVLNLEVEQLIAKEIERVGGMSLESQVTVYRRLTRDEKAARAFLAITGQRRRIWLRLEFGTDIFDE